MVGFRGSELNTYAALNSGSHHLRRPQLPNLIFTTFD